MEQRIVKLQIANEFIVGGGVSVGAVGSHDDVLLEMDFRPSAVWAGTTRRAIFANALGENRTVIVLTTNLLEEGQGEIYLVPVPQEAKDVAGECFLTIEGFVRDGDGKEIVRCVTEEAKFRVLPSKLYTNDTDPITPSQAEQLQAEIDKIKDDILEVDANAAAMSASRSEAWAIGQCRGEEVPEDDPAYHNNAKYWSQLSMAEEPKRQENENVRISNENVRISNEEGRVTAETARDTAEKARDEAEKQRAAAYPSVIQTVTDARDNAVNAAASAQAAKAALEQSIVENPGSTIIDSTLSVAGAAAEAAAVGQLKQDLVDLYSYDEEVEIDKSVTGYYDLSVGVGNTVGEWKSSSGYAQRKIEARGGNKFYIYGEGGTSPRLWAFVDADDKIISVAEAQTIVNKSNPIIISAPTNTKYAYFTVQIVKEFKVVKSVPKYEKSINELDARIINNKTEIDGIKSGMFTKVDVDSFIWESGVIQSNGVDAGNVNRIRSRHGVYTLQGCMIDAKTGFYFGVFVYKDKECKTLIESMEIGSNLTHYVTKNRGYVRICVKRTDNKEISSDFDNVAKSAIEINGISDKEIEYKVSYIPNKPYKFSGEISLDILSAQSRLNALYDAFDTLVTRFPNNISMEVLGTDQTDTYELRCYTIRPNKSNKAKTLPKILWLNNIHGEEPNSIVSCYYIAKELLENHSSDANLQMLFANCQIMIIPAVNPYGVEHKTRENGRVFTYNGIEYVGVNLNRNFDANWQFNAPDETKSNPLYNYGGTSANSEKETQIIVKFIKDNADALFAVNKHDNASISSIGGYISYATNNWKSDISILDDAYNQQDTSLRENYPWIENDLKPDATIKTSENMMLGTYTATPTTGSMDKWYSMIGMHGGLLEVANGAGTQYNDNHTIDCAKIHVEVSINYMVAMYVRNKEILADNEPINQYTVG